MFELPGIEECRAEARRCREEAARAALPALRRELLELANLYDELAEQIIALRGSPPNWN